MSSEEKMDLESILLSASEGTNGLSEKDKLQSVSETVYNIVTLMIAKTLDGASGKWNTLCKMVVECKWAIVVLVGIVVAGSIFQPQLCALLAKLVALL